MTIAQEIIWFVGYIIFELMVWSGAWYFFSRVIAKGVDNIPHSDTLFTHHDEEGHSEEQAGDGFAKPTFASKPMLEKTR